MNFSKIYLIVSLFSIVITGCQSSTSSPTLAANPTSSPTLAANPEVTITAFIGYPEPGYPTDPTPTLFDYSSDTGYPVPESTPFFADLPEKLVIPTPEAGTGIVVGQLLTPGPGGQPFYNQLYLARTLQADQEGYPLVTTFSEDEDPVASQDKTGTFLFVNIKPGVYALAIWAPVASTIYQDPETQDYMLFEVREGETTDLGIIGIP
jgi:hypothetical protein